jgi:sulfite reductase (NADPH) flavoprotein alpha-component
MGNLFASPLTNEQLERFSGLINSLNPEQLAWVSGYLAALNSKQYQVSIPIAIGIRYQDEQPEHQPQSQPVPQPSLSILYGSRTGNGESLAKKAQKLAADFGLNAMLKNMEDYNPRDLQSERNLLVIVSTHGEGEPPFAAKELHEFIHGKRAPKLADVNFAVLSLGDSSYLQFCQTGIDFDTQLEKLGAKRVANRADCDVDFNAVANEWFSAVLPLFGGVKAENASSEKSSDDKPESETFTKDNPFQAEILEKINLQGKGSDRTTLHLELDADLHYEPGDSAGIIPINSTLLVNELLVVTKLDGDEKLPFNGNDTTLFEVLKQKVELSKITIDVLKRYLEFAPNDELAKLLKSPKKLQDYLYGRDIIDLFTDYPSQITAIDLVKLLRPLQPRLYSISSSPKAVPGELHLTVGLVEYENQGRNRRGTCTNYLNVLDGDGQKVPVFIEHNPNFRLPNNPETPIIMVGAGTGIAPYRAFVQHRNETKSSGKSWLFFGNRNFETEFLYQTEWQKFLKSGTLTRMDVAFSRDSEQRVYVQHRLAENAAEVYRWLEEGAHFYICGDRVNMATDVQNTLVSIIEQQGSLSTDEAQAYVNRMQKEKRLQLDVY